MSSYYNTSPSVILMQADESLIQQNRTINPFTTEPVEILLPSIIATTILLVSISIIGTIGNSLVVWAFRKQVSQGIVSGLFILLLACNDLFICLIVIPCTLYLDIWTGDTTDWICRIHLSMKGFVVPISACILMLIAMERFLLICFIPGIQMKRKHIIIALVIIFCIGLLCALPMGLHVTAIDACKEHDELLDLNTLKHSLSTFKSKEWFIQLRVTKRCDKDETYLNDNMYWYHQICVLILFIGLFIGTAGTYALIFLFVWRHESFMYEKYGNSKVAKGSWVRIHAAPNSSGEAISPSIWYPFRKRLSFRRKQKQNDNNINNNNSNINNENAQTAKSKQQSLSLQNEAKEQSHESLHQSQQQQQQEAIPLQQVSSTLCVNQPQADITTSTSFEASNLDRLSCACLCEKDVENEDYLKSIQNPTFTFQNLIHNSPGGAGGGAAGGDGVVAKVTKQPQCLIHLNDLKISSNDKNKSPVEMKSHSDSPKQLTAANLERRRKPHVRTAQTLALVAVNFIISYTPYLVYTTIPIQKRQVEVLRDKPHWTSQIRRVLFYMYFINSALNPIIYSCMNRHFRACTQKFYTDLKLKLKHCTGKSRLVKEATHQQNNNSLPLDKVTNTEENTEN
ncbi:unnamed protein product [Trichobilharzia szidati]|nr:unnamed protein product [Trichobilharzia szidati]